MVTERQLVNIRDMWEKRLGEAETRCKICRSELAKARINLGQYRLMRSREMKK